MVKKEGGEFILRSRKTGRVLGRSRTKQGIEHREKQVTFFKNVRKSRGGPGSLAAKVRNKRLVKRVRGTRRMA